MEITFKQPRLLLIRLDSCGSLSIFVFQPQCLSQFQSD